MAYSLRRGDASLQDGLRRIAADQIGAALAALDADGLERDEKVHEVRKRCKKLRGLLRLVRPGFAEYKRENAALRDAAARLSGLRDADVLIATYDGLVARYDEELDRPAFGQIRRRLTLRRNALREDGATDAALGAFRSDLEQVRSRVEGWRLGANRFETATEGMARTYCRARKAMRKARKHRSDEAMHEWRKRVKYHRYHAQILRRIWPGPMQAHADAADALGDLLGDHHDLAVFAAVLRAEPEAFGAQETVEFALALAERRRTDLAAGALALGTRLLAEEPGAIATRFDAYRAAWRGEDDRTASAVAAAA